MAPHPIDLVTVAGDDVSFWWNDRAGLAGHGARPIAFTREMTQELGRLAAAVIGVSGTGSIVSEQLARTRLRAGGADRFRPARNPQSQSDLERETTDTGRLKVEGIFADAVASHRGVGVAMPVSASVASREAVLAEPGNVMFYSAASTRSNRVRSLI